MRAPPGPMAAGEPPRAAQAWRAGQRPRRARPHHRGHHQHRLHRVPGDDPRRHHCRDRRRPRHRARLPRRRQGFRGRHGRPQKGGVFLNYTIMPVPLHHPVDILRLNTCGSVDDGKSTLIGRLLYDSRSLMEDQIEALERSADLTGGGQIDLSTLTDGLRAEREQSITIDVAYRYFATPRRRFIIADTPGHVQYTRNMVTGASSANWERSTARAIW